jgi:glucose/arabinose dehydrogenase
MEGLGMSRAAACLLVLVVLAFAAPAAHASVLPTGFQDTEVFTGLNEPTKLRFAPDGKVFIAERKGKILVYDSLSDSTPTLFADISEKAYDRGDRGILGMALDPKFDEGRPYVYVLYTYNHLLGDPEPPPKWKGPSTEGDPCPPLEEEGEEEGNAIDCPASGRLVRLTAEGDHAKKEVAGKPFEEVLVEDWCQQFDSHSIGDLQFDSEGNLYASAGEGADYVSPDYGQSGMPEPNECGDPPGKVGEALKIPTAEGGSLRSQNSKSLDGKVIRVDPDTGKGLPGNPLYASANENEKRIVAKGFRNPFRFTIDPETHEVYVGNVGWNTWEEIDRFAPPLGETPSQLYNSGWPCYEGPEETQGFDSLGLNVCEVLYKAPGSTSPPFFAYEHGVPITPEDPCETIYGSVLNGISFYEGSAFPSSYDGALFFSDGARQCIYVMFPGEDGRPDPSTVRPFLTFGGLYPTAVDIEEGPEGNLFYVNLFGEGFDPNGGTVHRIAYSSGNQPPVAKLSVDHEWGAAPLTAHFNASASSDADPGATLSYEWDLEGDGNFVSGASTNVKTFSDKKNHIVTVRVSDEHGATSVARVTVYPGDTPPEPEILAPAESLTWHVGQQIHFEGSASDAEEGSLLPTSLDWNSRIKHCPSSCHVHPLQAFPSVASGTLVGPEHDYPSGIELTLTATDSRGLAASKTVSLSPEAVELHMQSNPPGAVLTAGLTSKAAPFDVTAIKGSHLTLSAPQTFKSGGTTYSFKAWSDAGERVHTVTANASATYSAEYAVSTASLSSSQHWNGTGGLEVEFDASASIGEGLEYEWDPQGDGSYEAASATPTKTIAIADEAAHTVAVRVVDSHDAKDVAEETVHAVGLQIHSSPSGLPLRAAGVEGSTPFFLLALVGRGIQLSAPPDGSAGGIAYAWSDWSDGGAREHTIEPSGPATLTASYDEKPPVSASAPVLPGPETPVFLPETILRKHPPRRTHSSQAAFRFAANQAGAHFRCKLDSQAYRSCPATMVYKHLKPGPHTLRVVAIDAAGVADRSPLKFSWTVL